LLLYKKDDWREEIPLGQKDLITPIILLEYLNDLFKNKRYSAF
jgi:hypothetical protein